jgi:hypothetical protein
LIEPETEVIINFGNGKVLKTVTGKHIENSTFYQQLPKAEFFIESQK